MTASDAYRSRADVDPGLAPRWADDEPVMPSTAPDDSDLGWGNEPNSRDEDWYRRERPPHHE